LSKPNSLRKKITQEVKKESHPGQRKASARKKAKGKSLTPYHPNPAENMRIIGKMARESAHLKQFNSGRISSIEDNRDYSYSYRY
jgi:hypothetical protein